MHKYVCTVCGDVTYSAAAFTKCGKCGGPVISEEARTADLIDKEGPE